MKPRKKSIESNMNILELAHHLRQEHLFILSEKQQIQKLNGRALQTSERLFHFGWIIRQQRANLDRLLSKGEVDPATCCFLASAYESVTFVDSYKKLGVLDTSYSTLLGHFRKQPSFLAQCLSELHSTHDVQIITQVVVSSLYGECIVSEDKILMLTLLKELIFRQVAANDNPRRLLRHGSCAFSRIYKMFSEGMSSAKLFLISALHDPVINVLAEDDLYLDTDAQRAIDRFPTEERLRHFGKEGSEGYAEKVEKYKLLAIEQLGGLVLKFVESIKSNFFCFPESICWLVRQLSSALTDAKKEESRVICAICADLVFGHFICHAIVHPELYGIVDMHISQIARFNLTQVAQVVQVLAMSKWEEVDPKLSALYEKFPKNCLSSQLDFFLKTSEPSDKNPPKDYCISTRDVSRKCILITEPHLQMFVGFLQDVNHSTQDANVKEALSELLVNFPRSKVLGASPRQNSTTSASDDVASGDARSKKTTILNRGSKKSGTSKGSESCDSLQVVGGDPMNKVAKMSQQALFHPEVLVIPVESAETALLGMASEEKILELELQKRQTKVRMNLEANAINNDETDSFMSGSASENLIEKRTRFSQDQESIGTCDNLEVISEAASNHSVASSLDLEEVENENDNLSDMVSANVSSGRGTPNVSGRETPSSHSSHSDEEPSSNQAQGASSMVAQPVPPRNSSSQPVVTQAAAAASASAAAALRNIPVEPPNRSGNQNDIEEKFGKFDFKPTDSVAPDETKSLLSDTWSTDVLASDSEAFEQHDTSAISAAMQAMNPVNFMPNPQALIHQTLQVAEFSETASQSDAWSTDVLMSDTERLQEFDLDETGSVRSTTRSEDMSVARSDVADLEDAFGAVGGPGLGASSSSAPRTTFADDHPRDGTIRHISRGGSAESQRQQQDVGSVKPSNGLGDQDEKKSNENNSFSNSNMQTLGRLSFGVRNKSLSEEEAVSFFMPFLRGKPDAPKPSEILSHRSSITELLAIDIAKPAANTDSDKLDAAASGNLIDFEQEFAAFAESRAELSDGESKDRSKFAVVNGGGDLSAASSTNDFRFSFTSVSSSATENETTAVEKESDGADTTTSAEKSPVVSRSSLEATGAIPKSFNKLKSISSRSKRDSGNEEHGGNRSGSNRRSFFKIPNIRTKVTEKFKSMKDKRATSSTANDVVEGAQQQQVVNLANLESVDDILEKYRAKQSTFTGNGVTPKQKSVLDTFDDIRNDLAAALSIPDKVAVFNNTKRKLRRVLSVVDIQSLPFFVQESLIQVNGLRIKADIELIKFLKVLFAEAKHLQNSAHVVVLQETIRCVEALDDKACQQLFWALREDYNRRSPYISYLIKSRQNLLSIMAHFDSLLEHQAQDKVICTHNLMTTCVKQYMEEKEKAVTFFLTKFQKLTVADEKVELVDKFLTFLFKAMEVDTVWQMASEEQLEYARGVIERSIISQIYIFALYPNGDGDVMRDQLLLQHMQNLAKEVSPGHKDLRIPPVYHSECPWTAAQEEILTINAYKTSREKVQCITRTCTIIMNLLSLASDRSVPAADDLMPVLVFVLIKASPPSLLSTVQYVNSFYEKQFEGEEAYWWIQFCSAVEFIKTMN